MPAGLPVALALLAQATSAAPAAPAPLPAAAKPADPCAAGRPPPVPTEASPEIVICAPKPEGYRIDPDILKAKRQMRTGRPKRPERLKDSSCKTVGPAGCMGPQGIDLLNAVAVLGSMAKKAADGDNVGQMFVTDPQPDEYQLYLEAKAQREEQEAAKKAKAQLQAAAPAAEQPTPKP